MDTWPEKHYRWRHYWAVRSRLKPMAERARMIQQHFDNASESINSKTQWVKYTTRGFRRTDNFVTAIYFHWGGLDLMPAIH
jgi:transposase